MFNNSTLKRYPQLIFICFTLCLFSFSVQAINYKNYKRIRNQVELFDITVEKEKIIITVANENEDKYETIDKNDINKNDGVITFGQLLEFNTKAIELNGQSISYKEISTIITDGDKNSFSLTFYKNKKENDKPSRFRKGNLFEHNKNIIIEENDFIRGFIFSVNGNIEIYGETNKDVISLFGDIFIGPKGVVRGNVITLNTQIDITDDASIYGEIYSGKKQRSLGKHYFYRDNDDFSLTTNFNYNKVDGFSFLAGVKYHDADSLLPTLWAKTGYAFASERSRFFIGLEQTLYRTSPLSIGGEIYRRLASNDDWLLHDNENLVFALMAAEDFKDYFEAEGGTAFIKFKPIEHISIETRYRFEKTNWLNSHPKLWAIFGRNKDFDDNFKTVPEAYRTSSITEIDTTENGSLTLNVNFDNTNKEKPFEHSGFYFDAAYEKSHPDLNSDFHYTRHQTTLTRFQKLNKRILVKLSGTYGASDGYLPMHKKFYLGGLGTLRGYSHKEFIGNKFWMTNIEYLLNFPRSDFGLSLFWDVGQITQNDNFSDDDEVKHNIGVGLLFDNDLRVNIATRLDGAENNKVKTYVRFSRSF
ncbi:MAG: BamA/TamA family outer membrane protein [candidate division Zixibacteria bacterium]|nr:BamA/TamA family outer membrane protein [candidate division Zixibacteria bacterium]